MIGKIIRINLLRKLYGKFSYSFINYFESAIKKNPNLLRYVGHLKTRSCLENDILENLSVLIDTGKDSNYSETNNVTDHFKINNYKGIIIRYGTPYCCSIKKVENNLIKVIGYPKQKSNIQFKVYYYFINEDLILVEKKVSLWKHNNVGTIIYELTGLIQNNIQDFNKPISHYDETTKTYTSITNDGFKLWIRYYRKLPTDKLEKIKDLIGRVNKFPDYEAD